MDGSWARRRILLLAALAFRLLQRPITADQGAQSKLAAAVAFVHRAVWHAIYVLVALILLIPHRRIESMLESR
jgi:hypothetical protein